MAIIGNGITTGAAGLDEMITVSDAQPTVPSNKVWVKETSSEIVIPTAEELSDVKDAIDALVDTSVIYKSDAVTVQGTGSYVNREIEIIQFPKDNSVSLLVDEVVGAISQASIILMAYNGDTQLSRVVTTAGYPATITQADVNAADKLVMQFYPVQGSGSLGPDGAIYKNVVLYSGQEIYTALNPDVRIEQLDALSATVDELDRKVDESAITISLSDNIYDDSSMYVKNVFLWYSGDKVTKTAHNDYSYVTVPVDPAMESLTVYAKDVANQNAQIYSWYMVGSDGETIISKDVTTHPTLYGENPTTISIPTSAVYLLISLRFYNDLGSNKLMVNYGNTKKPYTDYEKKYIFDNSELLTADNLTQYSRKTIHISKVDNDTSLFLKMFSAYKTGDTDIIFERSTYTLSDAYIYMRDNMGDEPLWESWRSGLPLGNNCRYFFNGSTIISNAPATEYTGTRNILEVVDETCECYDAILVNNGGRYCIHDEGNGSTVQYLRKYTNIKMVCNTTSVRTFGCGTGFDASLCFDGCEFINDNVAGSPVSIHSVVNNPNNIPVKLNVVMKNCYINTYGIELLQFTANDDVSMMLFGNLWKINPEYSYADIISNNNTIIP